MLFPDLSWDWDLAKEQPFDADVRRVGHDWPTEAETMVGVRRLDNLHHCARTVLRDGVPGDFVETGVWRGGCAILMRAVLAAYEDAERSVWLADSFQGLPAASPAEYPQDSGDPHATLTSYLGVSIDTVQANFRRYGLLDDRVKFLPGWFRDTLPVAPCERIAILRLDGDMYESTHLALTHSYPKLESGRFLIVDDYGALPNCRRAIEDFRHAHAITESILAVDWTGVYWRKAEIPATGAFATYYRRAEFSELGARRAQGLAVATPAVAVQKTSVGSRMFANLTAAPDEAPATRSSSLAISVDDVSRAVNAVADLPSVERLLGERRSARS